MLWNVLMAIFPLVLTQNQQWQVIEKNALNHFIPGVTKSQVGIVIHWTLTFQVKSIASCKGLTAAANLCLTMANGVSKIVTLFSTKKTFIEFPHL